MPLWQFMGNGFISAKELAKMANLRSRAAVLSAEGHVLDALRWDLNLITPAHYVTALKSHSTHEADLHLFCMFFSSGPDAEFKPSVLAAHITGDPFLNEECSAEELAALRQHIVDHHINE